MKKIFLILSGFILIIFPLYAGVPMFAEGCTALHIVTVNSDGKAYAWGYGTGGQMGNGVFLNSRIPVAVNMSGVLSGKTITALAAGACHSIALDSNGKIYTWGRNNFGQLGNNSTTNSSIPVEVDASGVLSGKTIIAIAAGYEYTLALDSNGKVYTWGRNEYGQLGNNSTTNSWVPVAVDTSGVLSGKKITAIAAGIQNAITLDSDENMYSWGRNNYGQLGNNSTTESWVPVAVDTSGVLSGKTIIAITATAASALVLDSDRNVYSWGWNYFNQLGNNSTTNSSIPVEVDASGVLSGKTIIAISGGYYHSIVLDSEGKVYTWGRNKYGQLGNNSTTDSSIPVEVDASGVLSGKKVTAIVASYRHCATLDSDGKAYTWGWNGYGSLGNNTATDSPVPVKVYSADEVGELPLPITLDSFSAQTQQGNVVLNWQTASETNNAGFVIYRNNVILGSVEGAGTSSDTHTYSFVDDQTISGSTYTYMLADVSNANEETKYPNKAITVSIPENDIPTEFALETNYPNPFNPTTILSYQLSAGSNVNFSIYDMNGKKVATLVNESQPVGNYSLTWNATDFSTGIYFYRLQAGDFVETRKMVFMK